MYNDVIFLFSSRASCYYICNQKKRKDIVMKTNNICKFVVSASEKQIFTTNFVLEHDLEQMRGVHQAENYSMRLVLSGNGKISIGHMSAQLQAGTVFFTFPKLSYELDVDEQFTCMYITFYGLRAPELLQRFRVSSDNCIFEGNEGLIAFWTYRSVFSHILQAVKRQECGTWNTDGWKTRLSCTDGWRSGHRYPTATTERFFTPAR